MKARATISSPIVKAPPPERVTLILDMSLGETDILRAIVGLDVSIPRLLVEFGPGPDIGVNHNVRDFLQAPQVALREIHPS